MSLDLSTARHPQALLASHLIGRPLTVEHGAPLRLLVLGKQGLHNINVRWGRESRPYVHRLERNNSLNFRDAGVRQAR